MRLDCDSDMIKATCFESNIRSKFSGFLSSVKLPASTYCVLRLVSSLDSCGLCMLFAHPPCAHAHAHVGVCK